MPKKTNKKVLYDIKTGTRVELPEDDKRSDMVAALATGMGVAVEENDSLAEHINSIESEPVDVDAIMMQEYGKVLREPCSLELLKCILRELIRIRIGGK